jgi:hypothetical protein
MIRSELGSSPFLPPFPRFIPSSSPETTTGTNPSDSDAAATSTRTRRRPSAIAASGAGEAQYHPQCPYSSRSPPAPPPGSAIRAVSSGPSPAPIPRHARPRTQQLRLPTFLTSPWCGWLLPFLSSPLSLPWLLLSCAYLPLLPLNKSRERNRLPRYPSPAPVAAPKDPPRNRESATVPAAGCAWRERPRGACTQGEYEKGYLVPLSACLPG